VTWLVSVGVVARRELAAYFYAPIAYVVGVLFLAIQGIAFAAIVRVLADPTSPAPYGAVLESLFGGSLLYWAVLFLVIAVVSMRLVAEDKHNGMWESLLTTRAGVGAVLVGKWLAAVAFYLMLWAPTALYLVVLVAYLPDGASLDWGPVLSAYVGVAVTGIAFLALGLAASVVTSNQIIAAVSSFAVLLGLLLLGELGGVPVDLRADMARFARGDIGSPVLAFYAGLTVVSLVAAYAGSALGRRRRDEVQGRAIATVLIAVIVVLANIIVARHPHNLDLSRDRMSSLDSRTRSVLAKIDAKLELLLIRPGADAYAPVFREVERVAERMAASQPLLRLRRLDPALQGKRVDDVAAEFSIIRDNLYKGGGVVLQLGKRRRARELLQLADFGTDELNMAGMSRLRAERSLATAIAELIDPNRPRICATTGHGELTMAAVKKGGSGSWAHIAASLRDDGMRVDELRSIRAGVPAGCRLLVLFGPRHSLKPSETLAVQRHLNRGGSLFVATRTSVPGQAPGAAPPRTGIDMILRSFGIELRDAIVVDPARAPPRDSSLTWITSDGYGEHAITRSFHGRRITMWQRPRAVAFQRGDTYEGSVLVSSSRTGWGETDLVGLDGATAASAGTDDMLGPTPIAVAVAHRGTSARVVVIGGARSLSTELNFPGYANRALVLASIAWLTGRSWSLDIGERSPRQPRLIMTERQVSTVVAICVGVIPLAFAGLGGFIWWRRRRE